MTTSDDMIAHALQRTQGQRVGASQLRFLIYWLCQHGDNVAKIPKPLAVEWAGGPHRSNLMRAVKSLAARGWIELIPTQGGYLARVTKCC